MITKRSAIGVMDSGVGGLTTAKELQKLLPNENILYFGDNINVPYGNKSAEEIKMLTRRMIDFLIKNDVKVIAVACNTISTIIDYVSNEYDIKLIKVIDPVVDYVKNTLNKDKVGLIATNFTVSSGYYDKCLGNVKVYGQGSAQLAAMVDSGKIEKDEIKNIIKNDMNKIFEKENIEDVILGCTHYPIIENLFKECYPKVNFINPALEQAVSVKKYLEENDLLNNENKDKFFKIYTTGEAEKYNLIMNIMHIKSPFEIIKCNNNKSIAIDEIAVDKTKITSIA